MVLDIVMFFELLRFLWTLLNEYRMKLRKEILLTLCIYFGIYQPDFAPIRNGLNRTFPKIYQSLNQSKARFQIFFKFMWTHLGSAQLLHSKQSILWPAENKFIIYTFYILKKKEKSFNANRREIFKFSRIKDCYCIVSM